MLRVMGKRKVIRHTLNVVQYQKTWKGCSVYISITDLVTSLIKNVFIHVLV